MSRSFENFLLAYCKELTAKDTTSLKILFNAVSEDSPRAAEPLLLLALCNHREGYLLHLSSGTPSGDKFRRFVDAYLASGLQLEDYLASLEDGNRFKKVYLSWNSERTKLNRDRETLARVANEMDAMISEKGMTRAEAAKHLKLNKGNFYAFLKGDPSKIGRKTAMQAYRILQEAAPSPRV